MHNSAQNVGFLFADYLGWRVETKICYRNSKFIYRRNVDIVLELVIMSKRRIHMASEIMSLYQAKKNGVFQVASTPNISLLENLGINIGTKLTLQSRYALGGPVLLRVENSFTVAIGKDIATQIGVLEVTD